MGLMDLFSNMAEWDPKDLEAGGVLGASMMAKARKQAEEKANRPKPGRFCNKVCVINDGRCTPCLALQEECGSLFSQVEKLEEMGNLTSEQVQQLTQRKTITACSLCGAPYEKGNRACPYCGTAYPEGAIDFDVPLSKQERHNQMMSKAVEAWDAYLKVNMLQMQYLKETAQPGLMGTLQKFVAGVTSTTQGVMKQNSSDIQQGAEHYGVSVSQYLYGLAAGELKLMKSLQYEEARQRLNEQTAQRNAEFQRQQAQRAANNKSYTAMDWMQRRSEDPYHNAPHYMGSAASCTSCMHWVSGSDLCTVSSGKHYYFDVCDKYFEKR